MLHHYSASYDEGQIFVGVAGWTYPLWPSLLEVENASPNCSELRCLAGLFNLIEINSAYYHPPNAKTVKVWLAEVQSDKPFYFTVRIWNKLVRERALLLQNDVKLMKAALAPLQEAGKLGALIIPVAPALRYSESNESWLLGLVQLFSEFPLFVENLHASWTKSDSLLRLQDRGVGIVEVQDTEAANTPALLEPSRPGMAYLRCNGYGTEDSLAPHSRRQARTDYFYSSAEIASLAHKLKSMLPHAARCFVVFNNHVHGSSLANALQLRHALTGDQVEMPRNLLKVFPVLENIASAVMRQRDLFEESI